MKKSLFVCLIVALFVVSGAVFAGPAQEETTEAAAVETAEPSGEPEG